MDNVRLKGFTFVQIPMWLLACCDVEPQAKVIYGYLVWRQGRNPKCWPSVDRIAVDLQISRASVLRHLARLEELRYIHITRTPGRANEYTVDGDPPDMVTVTESMAEELKLPAASTGSSTPVSSTLPVAQATPTSITGDTGVVAPVIPDQCHPRHPNYIQQQETETIDREQDVDDAQVKELRQWLLGIGYSEQNAESLALKSLEQGLTLRGARAWWEHIRQHNSQRGRNKIRSPLGFLMAKLQSGDRLPEERVRELLPFDLSASESQGEEEPAAPAPVPTESQRVWGQVLAELERTLTRAQYDSFLFGTVAERRNGSWLVECTNKLQVDWMTHRLKPLVERTLSAVVGEPSHVEFVAKERTG